MTVYSDIQYVIEEREGGGERGREGRRRDVGGGSGNKLNNACTRHTNISHSV